MGFVSLNHEEAKSSHQSFYNGEFEVMPMERCNFWDVFPANVILGIVDMAGTSNWAGLISTDGHKVVITKSKWSNLAKHAKTFEFKIDDINLINHGPRKVSMLLDNKIKGLTMPKVNYFIKLILLITIVSLLIVPFLKGKLLEVELDDQFKNLENFKSLLNK